MDPDRLKSIPLFESLSGKERAQVARWADEVDVPAGKHLVDEGEFGWEFFVIEEGAAEVKKGEETLATLGPGDFFGELALVEEERRTASVVATEPTVVIVMTAQDFRHMERDIPEVTKKIQERIEGYRR